MHSNYVQYMIKETDKEGVVHIFNDRGAAVIANQFATAAEVASTLGVSRSSAYRIMQRMARYEVADMRCPDELHCYNVVKRSDLTALQRSSRGNPNFTNPKYQRDLAKRPRKKKLDT